MGGIMIGDMLGAVPGPAAVPATSSSSAPRATADGAPVNSTLTPRQTVFSAAAIVVVALAILLFGSRVLKDARIG